MQTHLTDTRPILEWIDASTDNVVSLAPKTASAKALSDKLIALIHDDSITTNIPLLQFRNPEEHAAKRASPFYSFMLNRQSALEKHAAANPSHPFYGPKTAQNGGLYTLYASPPCGPDHEALFKATNEGYIRIATILNEIENSLVLPYATGEQVGLADLHLVPWFSHAMIAVGTKEIDDLDTLQKAIARSSEGFEFRTKTREWWKNMQGRQSFKKIFSKPR